MLLECKWKCRRCQSPIGTVTEGKLHIGGVLIIECIATCPRCGQRRRYVDIPAEPRVCGDHVGFGGRTRRIQVL